MEVFDGARLSATVLMVATCGGLAVLGRRARGARRWAALVVAAGLAAGWVSIALGDDDFEAPALRREAPSYGAALWIEACAPAATIATAWMLVRRPR